jgi:hypothetical protein
MVWPTPVVQGICVNAQVQRPYNYTIASLAQVFDQCWLADLGPERTLTLWIDSCNLKFVLRMDILFVNVKLRTFLFSFQAVMTFVFTFQSPMRHSLWRGTRMAMHYRLPCLSNLVIVVVGSEDCLYIDVFVPQVSFSYVIAYILSFRVTIEPLAQY